MHTTLQQKMNQLPADRRARIEAMAGDLIAEAMTLAELRRALDLTQASLAGWL